jgi:hypothetical protein
MVADLLRFCASRCRFRIVTLSLGLHRRVSLPWLVVESTKAPTRRETTRRDNTPQDNAPFGLSC